METVSPAGLHRENRSSVLWLVLDRPHAANALDRALFTSLTAALADAAADAEVRAVVVTGAGHRAFSAGRDMKRHASRGANPALEEPDPGAACLSAMVDFPKPLVAALNGPAIGFGCMLALLADRVVACQQGAFALPEIDLGISSLRGMSIVAHVAGHGVARDLALSGRRMDAMEAQQRGLVAKVVEAQDLGCAAQAEAEALAAKPAAIYAANKAWLHRGLHEEFVRVASLNVPGAMALDRAV